MELIGNLKKKVDKAKTKEEKRELIEEAGMKLNDVELEMITGGTGEDWNEIARRMYDNSEHETDSGNDDDLWTHSKAKKGKLYRR